MDDKNIPPDRKPCSWKYSFTTKRVFCHSEATICVTWKVANLDVQIWVCFGEIVFSLQLNTIFFSISIGQIQASFFHSIFRNISAVFSSSFLYLLMNLHCHILAYNMTSLCLAPKELGMNCLQLVHAASILPVWHLMVTSQRNQRSLQRSNMWRSKDTRDLCSVATCNVARIPEISAA